MFTTRMVRLFAVVLGRDSENVTEELLRAGVMQFINVSLVQGSAAEKLDEVEIFEKVKKAEEVLGRRG